MSHVGVSWQYAIKVTRGASVLVVIGSEGVWVMADKEKQNSPIITITGEEKQKQLKEMFIELQEEILKKERLEP